MPMPYLGNFAIGDHIVLDNNYDVVHDLDYPAHHSFHDYHIHCAVDNHHAPCVNHDHYSESYGHHPHFCYDCCNSYCSHDLVCNIKIVQLLAKRLSKNPILLYIINVAIQILNTQTTANECKIQTNMP